MAVAVAQPVARPPGSNFAPFAVECWLLATGKWERNGGNHQSELRASLSFAAWL